MLRYIFIVTAFIFPIQSWAACTGPAGVEAQILYNSDHKTVQYCDDTSWIALGKADLTTALANLTDTNVSPTDGQVLTWDNANSEWIASDTTSGWQVPDDAAVCSGGGITGTIRYNSGKIQVCNNTDWVDVGGAESGGVWSLTGNDISNSNTGNVGIGEPSPTTKLHVAGTTTTDSLVLKRQIGLIAPTSTAGWNYSGGNMEFSGGNVGIGTTSPDGRLHVQNGGSFSGTVNSNNLGIFAKTTAANSVAILSVVGGSSGVSYLTLGGDGAISFDDGRVSYDASDQSLGLWTNNAQRVTIDSSGKVGIGTDNPAMELHIAGAGGNGIRIEAGNNTSAVYLDFADSDDTNPGQITYNHTGDYLAFRANDAERMRITSTGTVGIGTASPDARLDVAGNVAINVPTDFWASGEVANHYGLHTPYGYIGSNGAYALSLFSNGYRNSSGGFTSLGINGNSTASGIELFPSGIIQFRTGTPTGTSVPERMRIDVSGNVGIGTTNPQAKLDVAGSIYAGGSDIYFTNTSHNHTGIGNALGFAAIENATNFGALMILGRATGGADGRYVRLWDTLSVEGTLRVTGNAYKPGGGSWAATSDARLKDVRGDYDRGLSDVVALKPVRFNYKVDNPRHEPSDKEFVGLIAQDVKQVFPEAVTLGDDGYFSLETTPINFAVINAIKELKSANDNLTSANEILREITEQQGRDIEQLKAAIQGQ